MFWKKKAKQPEQEIKGLSVMPDEFYGGKDPVLHYVKTEKTISDAPIKPVAEKHRKLNFGDAIHGPAGLKLSAFFHKKTVLIVSVSIILVAVVAGFSWYYVYQAKLAAQQRQALAPKIEPPQLPPKEEPIVPEAPIEPATTTEAVIEEAPTADEPAKPIILEFPNVSLAEAVDDDNDALSDFEELVFDTDSGVWDTDGDGFYDGQEVFNLYNPKGTAPMRIIDSGLVKDYINPVHQYRVYYPAQWAAALIDETADRVLLSALSGDYVEVIAEEMWTGESFVDWFGRRAEGQLYSDLQVFNNRFKEDGWKRKDDLVAYFVSKNKVFILIYHPGTTGDIAYRHIMQMMEQSFRPAKTTIEIPEQPVLPPVIEEAPIEPVATSTEIATGTENVEL